MTADEVKKAIAESATPDAKAEAVETMLWDFCRSPENVIYCFVMADRLDRVRLDDIARSAPDPDALEDWQWNYATEKLTCRMTEDGRPEYFLQGVPLHDVEAYEDTMLSTGQTLSAMCFKYLATLNPATLDRAHQLFEGAYAIYELGLEEEPGWLPKPYGFKCSGQSSMDNQCPFYVGLLRYYRIAPPEDKERIVRLLKDEMGYWMRHRYAMHRDYFGTMIDMQTNKFYPDHWPLLWMALCHGLWKITGEEVYAREYQWLMERLDISRGADPEYLRTKIGAFHRWYYMYGALLEMGAEPRDTWLKGLRYQVVAMKEDNPHLYSDALYDVWHHAWIWLEPHQDEDRKLAYERLMAQNVDTFRYKWPPNNGCLPPLNWREDAMYGFKNTNWLEMFWKGRLRGDW